MYDSTDIAHFIEKSFPQPRLIPRDLAQAALVHVFEDWADESLYFYEVAMRLGVEHNARMAPPAFAETMPGKSVDEVTALLLVSAGRLTSSQGIGRKSVEHLARDTARHLRAIDHILSADQWLVGDTISLANIAVAVQIDALLKTKEGMDELKSLTALGAWMKRIDSLAPS